MREGSFHVCVILTQTLMNVSCVTDASTSATTPMAAMCVSVPLVIASIIISARVMVSEPSHILLGNFFFFDFNIKLIFELMWGCKKDYKFVDRNDKWKYKSRYYTGTATCRSYRSLQLPIFLCVPMFQIIQI